jgi:hypothetical protein
MSIKSLGLFLIFLSLPFLSRAATIKDAPLEWLITQTMIEISSSPDSKKNDELINDIFKAVQYDAENDDLILLSSKKTFELRSKLLIFLTDQLKMQKQDPRYQEWKQEEDSTYSIAISKYSPLSRGHYIFNHVHTNVSQDNQSLKWLKISPEKTFNIINGFLKKRKTKGIVNFCDHDTDRTYDLVSGLANERLIPLRSIEWGGKTHMNLVGIKKDWDLLSRGREFGGEESIIMSRSSEGFRIINHPNARDPIFPYTSWSDADGVEVWTTILENSPFKVLSKLNPANNRDALKQWSDAIASGKRHSAVSGSDFHFIIPCLRDRALFYPANFVPSDHLDQAKQNLHLGNVSILTHPSSPKLSLKAKFETSVKWSGMGESLYGSGDLKVELMADMSDSQTSLKSVCYNTVNTFYKILTFWKKWRWEVRFYNLKGDVIAKKMINPRKYNHKKSFKASFSIPINGPEIIRAELWRINKKSEVVDLLGLTNPIYLNR